VRECRDCGRGELLCGLRYECRITGPAERVSIRMRCGRPRSRREAESYAVMAAVVREESACAWDCDWAAWVLLSAGGGECEEEDEEEIRGVRPRSAR
jgi:hypothetical protein